MRGLETGRQPLQMPHNCAEQMNINVTVKPKMKKKRIAAANCAEVGGQRDMFCI